MAHFKGTAGNDSYFGTSKRDKIQGKAGSDELYGLAGDDKIDGGDGDDRLFGGDGKDKIDGGDGNDLIEGGLGDDRIKAGDGDDTVTDAGGDDDIDTGKGNDSVTLSGGDNRVKTKDGDDTVVTGDGDDRIDTGRGNDDVRSGGGDDDIKTKDGNDTVDAGDGDDVVKAGAGSDTVFGGAGDDRIFGDGSGGGSGSGAGAGFDDYLDGGVGNDWIVGGRGEDAVFGGDGDDVLFGDDARGGGSGSGGNGFNLWNDGAHGGAGKASGGSGKGSGHGAGKGSGKGSGSGSGDSGGFDDYLDGGIGNDFIFAGGGDDEVVHNVGENAGFTDRYAGDAGVDTLSLELTEEEWFRPEVQSDIANYLQFLADHTDPVSGEADSATFQFTAFDLSVREFEKLRVFVDGVELDPADDPVTAIDDSATVNEDDGATVFASVLGNDDVPDLAYSVRLVSGPAAGVLVFAEGTPGAPDGSFSFDPNGEFEDLAVGESRDVNFVYEVTDANGDTAQATATITITGTNDDPTLAAALADATEDGPSVDVDLAALGADVDGDDDGATLSYAVTGAPAEGSASISGTTLSFDPGSDFQDLAQDETRAVEIEVTATDAHGATAVDTVTVTVTGTNDDPTLAAALADAAEDGPSVDVDLSALGADVDGDDDGSTLSYAVTGAPAEGSASISGTTLSFDPGADFQDLAQDETRAVEIEVTATDAHGATAVNTVTVTVTGTNDAPVAEAVTGDVAENPAVETQSDSIDTSYVVPNIGQFYVFDFDTGTATTIPRDTGGNNTAQQIADLHLSSGNGVVVHVNPNSSGGTNPGWGISTHLFDDGNATPVAPTAYAVSDPDGGSIDTSLFAETIYFPSDNGLVDEVSLSLAGIELSDGRTVDLSLSVNDLDYEVLTNDDIEVGSVDFEATVASPEDEITVAADFSDVDTTDTHTFSVDTTGTQGAVTDHGDGTFSYSANGQFEYLAEGETATDSFTYTVDDGNGGTDTETVTITITGTNEAPEIALTSPDTAAETLAETNSGLTISSTLTYRDADLSDTVTTAVTAVTAAGLADLSPLPDTATLLSMLSIDTDPVLSAVETAARRGWTFDSGAERFDHLAVGESVALTYTIEATDSQGATATKDVTVTITGTNDDPTLAAALADATEDGPTVDVDLAPLGADVDGDDDGSTLSYAVTGTPSEGSASISGTTLSFDPGADFQDLAEDETRAVEIEVTATDAHGATAVNTVTVTVTGTNDAPDVTAIDAGSVGEDDPAVTIDLLDGQTDVDNAEDLAAENIVVTDDLGNPVAFTDNGDGTIDIDPAQHDALNDGESRTLTVSYDVSDGIDETANTASLVVEGATDNAAPVANDDNLNGVESVDWLSDAESLIGSFGEPNTSYYGQTFVAEGDVLNEVSFGLNANPHPDDVEFRLLIAEVDLTEISAGYWDVDPETVLFESGTLSVPAGTSETVSVDTGGVNLNAGTTYAVIIDAFSEFDGLRGTGRVDSHWNNSGDPDGQFFYLNVSGGDRASHFDANWTEWNGSDMALALDYGNPTIIDEDTAHTIAAADLLDNDTDADGDTLSISAVSGTSALGATITLNGDGSVDYDPTTSTALDELAEGETLEDSFTYTVSDGNGGTDTATVTLSVSGVDDPPVLTGTVLPQSGFSDEAFSYVIPADLFEDHDEGGAVSYDVTLSDGSALPSWLSFDAVSRTLSFAANAPQATDIGLYNLLITATEEDGQSATTAVTLTVLDGSLVVGTSGNDTLTGTPQGDLIQGLGGNDTITGLPNADVLDGGDGNDRLYGEAGDDVLIGGAGYDQLYGDDGDDNLNGGDGGGILNGGDGSDTMQGGSGNDRLYADYDGSSDDVLNGGGGDDEFYTIGYFSSDTVDGGSGDDRINLYVYGSESSTVSLGAGADTILLGSSSFTASNTLVVTDFDPLEDTLDIDSYLNGWQISGWDGASNPFGAGFMRLVQDGADTVLEIDRNGGGDAYVAAVRLQNTMVTDFDATNFDPPYPPDGSVPAGVTLTGTPGSETLTGTIGTDTISGLDGNDILYGGAAGDTLDGGDGNDTLYGEAGDDTLIGGGGSDYLRGDDGSDTMLGGDGNDNLFADTDSDSDDTLNGGAGDDRFHTVGYQSSDTVEGGSGNDTINLHVSGSESSTLILGSGADRIVLGYSSFNASNTVTVADFDPAEDMLDIDNFVNNRLVGWDGASNPFGAGFMRLVQDGADTVLEIDTNGGGDGYVAAIRLQNTTVTDFAAANFDPPYPPDGSAPVGVTLTGTSGYDNLIGAIGADTINGLEGNDTLRGGAAGDTLDGGDDNDYLYGDAGDDTLIGGGGNDFLNGGDGSDTLQGGDGNDSLYADYDSDSDDTLEGGAGDDQFYNVGYLSSDVVNAGSGNDTVNLYVNGSEAAAVTLGAGADIIFVANSYFNGSNTLHVTDFAPTEDVLNIDTYLNNRLFGWDGASNPFGAGFLRLVQDGADTVLEVDTNGGGDGFVSAIRFANTEKGDFSDQNFLIDIATSQGYSPDGGGVSGTTTVGTAAGETINGTFGDDDLSGLDGADTINGGNGADILSGGNGADALSGGFGDDILSGGSDADAFVFDLGGGDDMITDFLVGTDALTLLGGMTIASIAEVDTNSDMIADAALVTFSDDSSVLLSGVTGVTDPGDLL